MTAMEADLGRLRFGSDQEPGIRRTGTRRFGYRCDDSSAVTSKDRERIRLLVIPPAWTDVWIADDPSSHLQATGRDSKNRKQYRYHSEFTAGQAENKFADLVAFGHRLGALRRHVSRDLARSEHGFDLVVATVVRLLDVTSLRVGNIEYARTNESFGLTTLNNDHVVVRVSTIRLSFRGKSAHDFDIRVENARLAGIVRKCQHLPGQGLFEYRAFDGDIRRISSNDVNRYLTDHAGAGVTAKTFRTWNATVCAAEGLATTSEHGPATKCMLNEVVDAVADQLGNSRAVCRKSYVHPVVVESYFDGSLLQSWQQPARTRPSGLTIPEHKTLRLLRRRA